MNSRKVSFALAALLVASISRAEVYLRLIQPYESSNLPSLTQSFVFGSVSPATATLTLNGIPVTPYTNGGFLAMIPFREGRFKIEAVATDGSTTTTVVRTVNVASPAGTYPSTYSKIDMLAPKVPLVVRPGDIVAMSFQAAPGGQAHFRFKSQSDLYPMEEQGADGLYKGQYLVHSDDKFDNEEVTFVLKRRDGKRITAKTQTRITVQRRKTPRMIELKEDSVLLTGPDADYGYNLFALQGTRLEVTGEYGDFLRVAVGESNQNWVKRNATQDLPNGTSQARSVTRNMRVGTTPDAQSTLLEIPLQFRHPHRIEQSIDPHHLKLTLYGVTADSDRIRYKTQDSVIEEVTWFQSEPTTCVFDIRTKQKQGWGYDVRYEGTTLILEIRHRPQHISKGASLKGLKIAVDAGHSKESFGTIGPWGNTEASITLMIAKVVKAELERRGATVVMTQDGTKELSLQERVNIAWREKAQFFFSIHADACGEGQDPREVQGYSVHYYHPQSHGIGETLHAVYGQKTGVRDEGLWRSNLAVCRATQMPSLLLETAFLILPEYEEMLLSPKTHQLVADSIAKALTQYMEANPK